MTTFTDVDDFMSQFVIEKENFGGVESDLIKFSGLPIWAQDMWRDNLIKIFSNNKVYGCLDKSARGEGQCWFSLENDGKENFFEPGKLNYVYNRFRFRKEAGTDNYLLMVNGFVLDNNLHHLFLKRERIEVIDSILNNL